MIIKGKGGIYIFNIFKRRNNDVNNTGTVTVEPQNNELQTRLVLEAAAASLKEIEGEICNLKEKHLFSNFFLFLSYYSFIIEFYNRNIESIISVKELLLLKYIDMIKEILFTFKGNFSSETHKEELLTALKTVNEKLFSTINNIKEQTDMNLSVDLKTLHDLIKTDF